MLVSCTVRVIDMVSLRLTAWIACCGVAVAPAAAQQLQEPIRFFEGSTVGESTVNILFHKAYGSKTIGQGRVNADGSLDLVQRVEEDGKAPFQRRWHMKPAGQGRWSGTMSDAVGPVSAEQVGNRYRFRFSMKDNVRVEQWLTPLAGGKAAKNEATIRKHGFIVGHSSGIIRKM